MAKLTRVQLTRILRGKLGVLILSPLFSAFFGFVLGFDLKQITALSLFVATVLGALLYWEYKLIISLFSVSLLLGLGVIDVETFIESAEFNIILFLAAVSILVAPLKRVGFFRWFSITILRLCNFSFKWFMVIMAFSSMIFACLMAEVSSIIFMSTIVLEFAEFFNFDPVPSILLIIMSTNIGSSGTALGNPVGLLLAFEAKLSFSEFLRWSFPLGLLSIATLCVYFTRKRGTYVAKAQSSVDKVLRESGGTVDASSFVADFRKLTYAIIIFLFSILGVASHSFWEHTLGLVEGTMLLGFGFIGTSLSLILYREEAKEIVEREVDWWGLLFIACILGEAGALKYTGVTAKLAERILEITGRSNFLVFIAFSLFTFTLSPFLDNISIIATITPIALSLKGIVNIYPTWWGLLISACYAGNITPLGAAANIVALGLLADRGVNVSLDAWIKECTVPTIIAYSISIFILITQFFIA
ncbi:MAG: SLC13 family permease [archaeon GBS-70-058]|mgnify:CR=1 FL=1|nr:SLC13 family permease [Candidatus Culexarchaeum nevadense]